MDRSDWRLIWLLFVAGLLAAQQFAKISLTLPALGVTYGREIVAISWLVSVVGLVGIVFGVVAGQITAALSPRRVLIGGLWLGAAASLVQAAGLPLWLLAATRVVEGASHLAIVVAAPTLIARVSSDADRPVAMGLWATFFGVSFAISALLVPAAEALGGLAGVFAGHGLGLALVALVAARWTPRSPTAPLRVAPWALHRALYTAPRQAMPALCFVFYTILFVALVTLLPAWLGRIDLAATLPLLSLAGTFGAGWLCRRVHPGRIVAAGFVITIATTLWAVSGSVPSLFALFAAMGIVPGACFALIPHLNRDEGTRALATGGIAQMGNVGTTLGTPVFAVLLAWGGIAALWVGVIALSLAGLAVCLILSRRV